MESHGSYIYRLTGEGREEGPEWGEGFADRIPGKGEKARETKKPEGSKIESWETQGKKLSFEHLLNSCAGEEKKEGGQRKGGQLSHR